MTKRQGLPVLNRPGVRLAPAFQRPERRVLPVTSETHFPCVCNRTVIHPLQPAAFTLSLWRIAQ